MSPPSASRIESAIPKTNPHFLVADILFLEEAVLDVEISLDRIHSDQRKSSKKYICEFEGSAGSGFALRVFLMMNMIGSIINDGASMRYMSRVKNSSLKFELS